MSNSPASSALSQSGAMLVLATAVLLASGLASAGTRSPGHIVTTSVTKLDLAALNASAFGDAEETR